MGAIAVPVKTEFYPTVLVGVDFAAGRAGDDGGLRARGFRDGRAPCRTVGVLGGDDGKSSMRLGGGFASGAAAVLHIELAGHHQIVFLVIGVAGVAVEGKGIAAGYAAQVATHHPLLAQAAGSLQAHFRQPLALAGVGWGVRVVAVVGPAVVFQLIVAGVTRQHTALLQPGTRLFEVEITAHPDAGFQCFAEIHMVEVLFVDVMTRRVVGQYLVRSAELGRV